MLLDVHGAETFTDYHQGHKITQGNANRFYASLVKCMWLGAEWIKNVGQFYESHSYNSLTEGLQHQAVNFGALGVIQGYIVYEFTFMIFKL